MRLHSRLQGDKDTDRRKGIIWGLTHVDMVVRMDTLASNRDANNLPSTICNHLSNNEVADELSILSFLYSKLSLIQVIEWEHVSYGIVEVPH